ncbi:unnamed protein product, partial [Prorocentrum cordatum]
MAPQDCYAVLGVPPTASLAEVRRAFHEQARAWHPDKCDRPEAADRFRLVREAFEVLSDHRQRGDHDAALRRRRAPAQPFFSDLPRPRAPAQKAQAFASTLSDLLAYVDSGADGLSVGELRRCCSACELAWPNLLVERHELLGEISKRVRDELDRRVCAGEWARLTKEDLVLWLDARGVTLKYALECDSVDKDGTADPLSYSATAPLVRSSLPVFVSRPSAAVCTQTGIRISCLHKRSWSSDQPLHHICMFTTLWAKTA